MDTMTMPVVFRADRTKELHVTAVFPTEPHDVRGLTMTCYAHVGQHGACSMDWYRRTRAAKPEEYADLLRELRGIYGTSHGEGDPVIELEVRQRISAAHRNAFRAEVKRLASLRRAA